MEIFINGEKIQFALENEKSFHQILSSLSNWLNQNHYHITQIILDGKKIEIEEASVLAKNIENIQKIEITAQGSLEQVEEMITTLNLYLEKFIIEINKGKEIFCLNKKEKLEGLAWIVESFTLITQNLAILPRHIFLEGKSMEEVLNFIGHSLHTLNESLHNSDFFYAYFCEGIKPRLLLLQTMISKMIQLYNFNINKQLAPDFISYYLKESQTMLSFISEITTNLQKGKDQDALVQIQKIMYFFELSEWLVLKNNSSQEEAQKLRQEILQLFEEIYRAFKDKDIVTVCDLLEYEIKEKLENYIRLAATN